MQIGRKISDIKNRITRKIYLYTKTFNRKRRNIFNGKIFKTILRKYRHAYTKPFRKKLCDYRYYNEVIPFEI